MAGIDEVIGYRIEYIPLMVDVEISDQTGTQPSLAMARIVGRQLGRAEGMLTTSTFNNKEGRYRGAVGSWYCEVQALQTRLGKIINSLPEIRGEMGGVAAQARAQGFDDTSYLSYYISELNIED